MPSRSTKSKSGGQNRRRKSKLTLGAWLWMLAILNLVLGMFLSPLTAPRRLSATDVDPLDLPAMSQAVQYSKDIPWARLNTADMASRLRVADRIERVDLTANIFGRVAAKVVYRLPVARLSESSDMFLDSRGDVYRDPRYARVEGSDQETPENEPPAQVDPMADLPDLTIPADLLQPSGAILATWEPGAVVEMIELTRSKAPQLDYSVEVDSQSVLSLRVKDGPVVVLGSSSDLALKLDALSRIIANEEDKFKRAKVIQLTAPDRPTYSP